MSEQMALYKLMVLYMLKRVNFPLTYKQITEFFFGKDYTNYFTFQQVMAELTESNLIRIETVRHTSQYEITKEGDEVLYYYSKNIPTAIIEDINQYFNDNKFKMRNETGIVADYNQMENREYMVTLKVMEGRATLISLELSVPTEEQAMTVCDHWAGNCQEVYSYIMRKLIKNDQ